jgi:hypothetical protein
MTGAGAKTARKPLRRVNLLLIDKHTDIDSVHRQDPLVKLYPLWRSLS